MRTSSKITVVVASGALAVAASGVAFAWWSTSGSGTGEASTREGEVNSMVITGSAGAVSPGTAGAPITGSVLNGGSSNGYVASVSATVVDTSDAGCDASNFSITGTSPVNVDLAPNTSTGFSGQTLNFVNKPSNQDACKDVTVNLSFSSI